MNWLTLISVCALFLFAGCACSQDKSIPADKPVEEFPLGVYLPWEYTYVNSQANKMEHWDYVKKTLNTLKQQNVDTIWLVNIGLPDFSKLLKLTIPMGFKLLPGLGEVEPRSHKFQLDPNNPDTYESARQTYKSITSSVLNTIGEDKKGVMAWVLGDEPTGNNIVLLDIIRECFREVDPDRACLSVNMWPQSQEITEKTRLTTFCVDLYPFFADKNPHGPHTPEASKNFYTVNAQRLVEAAGKDGRKAWIMGQCFSEIWGPYDADSKGRITALPGSFAHWRVPKVPEMRWQVWEAIRCGGKGFVFFTAFFSSMPNTKAKPVEDANLKDIVFKKNTKLGVVCLLDRNADPTPQMIETGKVYARLKPYKKLLSSLKPSTTEVLQGNDIIKTGCFVEQSTGDYYAVVVNSDLVRSRKSKLTTAPFTKEAWDVMANKKLECKPMGWNGGNCEISVELAAGDGMIIKIK